MMATSHEDKNDNNDSYDANQRLIELGIVLPPPPQPAANYSPVQRDGNVLYLSGHLPLNVDGSMWTGPIGNSDKNDNINNNIKTMEYGYEAAKQVAYNLISTLQNELHGDLNRVQQIIKLFGIVHATNDFYEHHKVINGASDVMVAVFGAKRGHHARSAIGANALPLGIAVEIEAIVRIKDE